MNTVNITGNSLESGKKNDKTSNSLSQLDIGTIGKVEEAINYKNNFEDDENLSTSDRAKIVLNLTADIIKEKLEGLQPYTHGQEGEVYKIEIDGKALLIAKKRFDNSTQNETRFHKEFFKVAKNSKSTVQVPEFFAEFIDSDDKNTRYMLMEYINGKTLYTLQLEGVIKQILAPKYRDIDKDFPEIYTDGKIDLKDDTFAEDLLLEILRSMYTKGLINDNPNVESRNENGKKYNPVLRDLYEDSLDKITLFSMEEKGDIIKNLVLFFNDTEKNKLFHRDIGGNPRNIMFRRNNSGRIIPYIIDFGMAATGDKDTIFYNQIEDKVYDRDRALITKLKYIGSNPIKNFENPLEDPENYLTDEEAYSAYEDIFLHSINYSNRAINAKFLGIKKYNGANGLFDFFKDRKNKTNKINWFIHTSKKLEERKSLENLRAKEYAFFSIVGASKDEIQKLKENIEEGLSEKKNTRVYKVSKIYDELLQQIEKHKKSS